VETHFRGHPIRNTGIYGQEIPELDGVGPRLLPVGVVIIAGGGVALLVLGVAGLLAHVAVVRTIACTGTVTWKGCLHFSTSKKY
jgi:hypothetical protein